MNCNTKFTFLLNISFYPSHEKFFVANSLLEFLCYKLKEVQMAKSEVIKDVFSKMANLAGTLADYAKTKNKKTFIYNFLLELIDIKGVEEEEEKALVESLIAFIESFVKLFSIARQCFSKK